MMNINEDDIDLRLALGSRNYSVETRLNSSSGAGVNANSRVDMPFAASDPLSELVWSPRKGLSLKCANSNSTLADNKPFLTWNVGESTKEISTSQSNRSKGSGDNKVSDEEKLSISPRMLDGAGNSGDKATVFRSSGGSCSSDLDARQRNSDAGEMEEAGAIDAIQEEKRKGYAEEDLCRPQNIQIADIAESSKRSAEQDLLADGAHERKFDAAINWKIPRKLETNASRSDNVGLAVPIRSKPYAAEVSEALVCSHPNLQSEQQPDDEVTSASVDVDKNKARPPISIPASTSLRLESSAENDLGHLAANEAHSLGEMALPGEDSRPVDRDPMNSRISLYREKGKEKASSDGDIYARLSHDEDDSHESVESCNSAGLFSKGIKRQHFDQSQLVGSKRMRRQIQGSPGSASIIKPDSSFVNWISNMVKGLSDSKKEESSPLALTLARSDNICISNHPENFMCNKTTDCARPSMGFQTVFQSLYGRSTKTSHSGVQKDNQTLAECRELMVVDERSLENLPRSSDGNNDNSCKQIILSDKDVNPHISGSPRRPGILSADFACTPNSCERSSAENKASELPERNRAKGEASSSGSLREKVNTTAEKTSLNIALPVSFMPENSSLLSSLWITRLYTRTTRLESSDRITEEARGCSAEKANLDSQANDVISTDEKISEARDDSAGDQVHASKQEMEWFSPKASIDLKSTHKLSPIQLSQKSGSSEAMASVFARRLDALRHIIPPTEERRKSPTCALICFFCGRSGHDLRKCPELTEAELENLLVKISSFERVEESPCLCIRCFQLDHWAISCPLVSSHENRRSEQNAGAIDHRTTRHLQLRADDKCPSHLSAEEDDPKQVVAGQVACSRKPILSSFPRYLTWNLKESSSERLSSSNEFQESKSSSEHHLKDKQIFLPCNFIDPQNAASQEEMFHAIRKLRLSRADILRWMDFNVSFSRLNGFFLRLRLGKLEGGPEGTGYYVACITGDTMEHIDCKSKKSILVDVGGIKSSVGSQYISNHDFLEDEIKAWWSRIVKTGGKIPPLHELNSRFTDRKRLGL